MSQVEEPATSGVRLSASGDPVFLEPGGILQIQQRRITARFVLIVIVLVALVVSAVVLTWRAVTYGRQAALHDQYMNSERSFVGDSEELRQWHKQMLRKYEYAASHPWLTVEPDPPAPE